MTGPDRRDPLDPAERALADALARGAPLPPPSPALDAAVLAAARAAAAKRAPAPAAAPPRSGSGAAPSTQRRRRRAPAWLRGGALAATLVLAVGVAWQMRHTMETPVLAPDTAADTGAVPTVADATPAPAPAESVTAAPGSTDDPAGNAPVSGAPARPPAPVPRRAPAASPPAEPAAGQAAADARATDALIRERREAAEREAAQQARSTAEAARLQRERAKSARAREANPQAYVPAAPPPPPPPPLPSPAAPPAASPAPVAAPVHAPAPVAQAGDATALDEAPDWHDQPLDDTPPASVDAPAVREAWLERIRELVAAGRHAEARDSLAEFRRRHPGAAIPDDLRPLLDGE